MKIQHIETSEQETFTDNTPTQVYNQFTLLNYTESIQHDMCTN